MSTGFNRRGNGLTIDYDDETWLGRAECRTVPPDLFFPETGGNGSVMQQARAVAVCNRCPVKRKCAQRALQGHETHGVWAGENMSLRGSARVDRFERLSALSGEVA